MKRLLLIVASVTFIAAVSAQSKSSDIKFELGKGLNVGFNNGEHVFHLGGYLQSNALFQTEKNSSDDFAFGVKRAYLAFGGEFYNNKLSFMMQMNYVDSYPLLDAWIGYRPWEYLKLSFGQKQSFSGTRSMMFYDEALPLGDRSLVDRTFFASGREFGIFAESRIPFKCVGFDLGLAVTSGDGRNAFGSTSADSDFGKLKYSGRLTFYPMGFFATGNELTGTDFAREKTLKIALGGAYSYNDGASSPNGEGFDEFRLYTLEGKMQFPGYQKISADLLLKYRGATFLAEYVNTSGHALNKLYITPAPTGKLKPRQIADYLILGNGYNLQAGYLFKSNWSVDAMFSKLTPEWSNKQELFKNTTSYTLGVAKYFIDNRLKIQALGSYSDFPDMTTHNKKASAELIVHIVF